MLKRPQRNANATARPVNVSVVAMSSICWRLYASLFTIDVSHQKKTWWFVNGMSMWWCPKWKNHGRPVPEMIPL